MRNTWTTMQYKDTRVLIDGDTFVDCEFRNCLLTYTGGEIPIMTDCKIYDCEWRFEGAAERTIVFMKGLFHGMGPGGREVIDATFKNIQKP